MAITRAQQAKQMLQDGGRIGLQVGGQSPGPRGQRGGSRTSPGSGSKTGGGGNNRERNRERRRTEQYKKVPKETIKSGKDFRDTQKVEEAFTKETIFDKFPSTIGLVQNFSKFNPKLMKEFAKDNPKLLNFINSLDEEDQSSGKLASALNLIGYGDFLAEEKGLPALKYAGDVGGLETFVTERDELTGKPIKYDFRNVGGGEGGGGQPIIPQTMMASAPAVDNYYGPGGNPFLNRTAFRLLADGGRIGFQVGGQSPGPKGQRGGSTIGPGGPGSGGGGNGNKNISGGGGGSSGGQGPVAIKAPVNIVEPKSNIEKFLDIFRSEDDDEKSLKESLASGIKNQPEFQQKIDDTVSGIMANPDLAALGTIIQSKAEGGRIGLMEGGMPYEGGIMDLESARQMFFLGKLVKSAKKAVRGVTRAVKKVAKSPIGKAALLAGVGYGLGGGFSAAGFQKGTLMSRLGLGSFDGYQRSFTKNALGKFLTSPEFLIAGGLTAAPLIFGTGEDDNKDQTLDRGERLDILGLRARGMRFDPTLIPTRFAGSQFQFAADGGRIGYQEGSKEPVAKKTMPLLDMGGKEMDLREEGGFVPIGRMEKADDVPARLSKNEFVFTADAVRNAGDGNVDKGAEVMYNMMKNLEAGGDVSEESQGLKGARRMFETSQRLEEVL